MKKGKPALNQLHISGATFQQRLYDQSIELLRLAEPPEGYYLATSFGKDSIAAQKLCDEAGVKYDAHHNLTGIDPPELVQFGRKYYPDVERHPPPLFTEPNGRITRLSMWKLIVKKMIPPMRHMRYCCDVLKEDGGRGRICAMGIRASESTRRRDSWAPLSTRDNKKGNELRIFDNDDIIQTIQSCTVRGKLTVSPLYHWPDDVLWDFIRDRKMPYCCLYDEGFDRLGCIMCPMANEKLRRYEAERWPTYYRAYLRAFQNLIDSGRFAGKASPEAIMEWWLSDKTQEKPIEGQELFEGWT